MKRLAKDILLTLALAAIFAILFILGDLALHGKVNW